MEPTHAFPYSTSKKSQVDSAYADARCEHVNFWPCFVPVGAMNLDAPVKPSSQEGLHGEVGGQDSHGL